MVYLNSKHVRNMQEITKIIHELDDLMWKTQIEEKKATHN
jgi:hypothetical protein